MDIKINFMKGTIKSAEINLSITFHYYPAYVIILYEQRNSNNKKFIFCRNECRFKYISK